jgi:hypothetical protein
MDIKINREERIFGLLPRISFTDKGSYVKSSTREYDMIAFKYLSWALFPLLGGYAVYSLLYLEHKGWYSWVLSMLYGFLLTFGKFLSRMFQEKGLTHCKLQWTFNSPTSIDSALETHVYTAFLWHK